MDNLYNSIILPVFNFLKDTFTNFWQDILDFSKEPTIEGLGKLIGENVVALGIITGLLAPSLLTTPLKAAVSLLGGAFTALSSGVTALLAPLAVPAAIAAGVVTVLLALGESIKAFETELANGEGVFTAIGSALATFFVELFKIPAEFIASLIPEDIKEKFFTITGDIIDAIVKFTKGFTDAILPENFKEKFSKFSEHWQPKVIANLNDYEIKLVKIKDDFVWHNHEETDEAFIVLEGEMHIEFEDRTVKLSEGEMLVVPKGVRHKPYAFEEAHIMIVEPKDIRNTGNIEDDLTAPNDKWV